MKTNDDRVRPELSTTHRMNINNTVARRTGLRLQRMVSAKWDLCLRIGTQFQHVSKVQSLHKLMVSFHSLNFHPHDTGAKQRKSNNTTLSLKVQDSFKNSGYRISSIINIFQVIRSGFMNNWFEMSAEEQHRHKL